MKIFRRRIQVRSLSVGQSTTPVSFTKTQSAFHLTRSRSDRTRLSEQIPGLIYLHTYSSKRRISNLTSRGTPNNKHHVNTKQDVLDQWLLNVAPRLSSRVTITLKDLYGQYRNRAGTVINRVVPYEESPKHERRAERIVDIGHNDSSEEGSGIVTVIYAVKSQSSDTYVKFCVCSGFVVKAEAINGNQNDSCVVISCAHTLEEAYHYLRRYNESGDLHAFAFILSSTGRPYPVSQILSSIPRSDIIAIELAETSNRRLRSLPLSPFPVYAETPVLTHLFGSPHIPEIRQSQARGVKPTSNTPLENPEPLFDRTAWQRWGQGVMLGYRSYTGQELEAGISVILPHILTSILPTPGSSGGPLVNADTGCVVGMVSGRRMDNRVEGERGWGTSAEIIYEMFSLPGFTPASKRNK